jgi:two-component system response regulator FixJ
MSTPATAATTVFVVDDDEAVRDSIKVLLEGHGFEVEDFASTATFTKGYRKPSRGCLILDQHLPLMTGIDFVRSAAGRELGIPVILMSSELATPALPLICRSRSAKRCCSTPSNV